MEQPITFVQAIPIWWAFTWRALLFSLIAGLALGVVVGLVAAPRNSAMMAMGLGWLIGIPITIWALKVALGKRYGEYSIALVRRP